MIAHNTIERVTSVVAMIIGVVMYGYLLGAIAATIANSLLPKYVFVCLHVYIYACVLLKGDIPGKATSCSSVHEG